LILSIYYKKLKIDWVLCEFYEPTISNIINEIIRNTMTTEIISYGNLSCRNKKDLKIIEKILLTEYRKREDKADKLPNLIEETIKTLYD